MMADGKVFKTGEVDQWMDCGNKLVTIETNQQVLINEHEAGLNNVHPTLKRENSIVIAPCFIGEGVEISNSIVGPYASIGKSSTISNSVISNSMIQDHSQIKNAVIKDSMIGSYVVYNGTARDLSVGDYTEINE